MADAGRVNRSRLVGSPWLVGGRLSGEEFDSLRGQLSVRDVLALQALMNGFG